MHITTSFYHINMDIQLFGSSGSLDLRSKYHTHITTTF